PRTDRRESPPRPGSRAPSRICDRRGCLQSQSQLPDLRGASRRRHGFPRTALECARRFERTLPTARMGSSARPTHDRSVRSRASQRERPIRSRLRWLGLGPREISAPIQGALYRNLHLVSQHLTAPRPVPPLLLRRPAFALAVGAASFLLTTIQGCYREGFDP